MHSSPIVFLVGVVHVSYDALGSYLTSVRMAGSCSFSLALCILPRLNVMDYIVVLETGLQASYLCSISD